MKPKDLDLSLDDLGIKLPDELSHLEEFSQYAKWIKEDVVGFHIPQFHEDKSPNEDWWRFRAHQIGSSEVATILDLDEYGDKVKLFYSKLYEQFPFFNTRFTSIGLHLEDKIADMARYHDGTEDGYVDNMFYGKVVREISPITFYAINIHYPHLAVSLDFLIPGGQVSPWTGDVIEYDFPLEIKNMSITASDKYILGIPQRYLAQLQIQMMVLGVDYSEIAWLVGGNDFKMMPVELDLRFCQNMLEKTYEFWNQVERGRVAYEGYHTLSEEERVERDKDMALIEPEPSGTEAFKEFMTTKYKVSRIDSFREGTDEEWEMGKEYKLTLKKIKELEDYKVALGNKIKLSVRNDETVDFGENGRILYKRIEGKKDLFRVNIRNFLESE